GARHDRSSRTSGRIRTRRSVPRQSRLRLQGGRGNRPRRRARQALQRRLRLLAPRRSRAGPDRLLLLLARRGSLQAYLTPSPAMETPKVGLVLGPMLRYAGTKSASFWVETNAPCEVEILGHRVSTFSVEGHHYALLLVSDLTPASVTPYDVRLDG